MHFEIYQGTSLGGLFAGARAGNAQDWRWRLKGGNGEIVASGEGYVCKANVERAIERLKEEVANAPIRHV